MRSDVVPGGIFRDYELPDHTGKLRKLSELQGDDPLILTLSRGHYCPKEHQQHLELAAFYPKISVAYTQIATISQIAEAEFQRRHVRSQCRVLRQSRSRCHRHP
jgi:peroxiredoxin